MSIIRRLAVFADDVPRTVALAQQLKQYGLLTHIIEAAATQETELPDTHQRASDIYEVVQGWRQHFVVQIYCHASGENYCELGAYSEFAPALDNWPHQLLQLRSPRPVQLRQVMNCVQRLVKFAGDKPSLIAGLDELNREELRWLKTTKVASHLVRAAAERPGEIILGQLGGRQFIVMIGPKNIVWLKQGIQFDISAQLNKLKANRITIELDGGSDEYILRAWKQRGLTIKMLAEVKNIQAMQLRSAFAEMTGMATSLR